MKEEEKEGDTFVTSRIDIERMPNSSLKERVEEAVLAQCEFI